MPATMTTRSRADRFTLAVDVIDRVPRLRVAGAHVKEWVRNEICRHQRYAYETGEDMPEVTNWEWPG
jgi:xylulose-5-phosphate/fructose-6-phosphate phosphoketolase